MASRGQLHRLQTFTFLTQRPESLVWSYNKYNIVLIVVPICVKKDNNAANVLRICKTLTNEHKISVDFSVTFAPYLCLRKLSWHQGFTKQWHLLYTVYIQSVISNFLFKHLPYYQQNSTTDLTSERCHGGNIHLLYTVSGLLFWVMESVSGLQC